MSVLFENDHPEGGASDSPPHESGAPDSGSPETESGWLLLAGPGTLLLLGLFTWGLYHHSQMFVVGIGLVALGVPFLWLLVSSFRPALPDRDCPSCGEIALVLIDPQEEYGVRCLRCDFKDSERRIPYLAEVMGDPAIALEAGFVLDDYGVAWLPPGPPGARPPDAAELDPASPYYRAELAEAERRQAAKG